MYYNKLVRDKIPDIIRKKGTIPITHIADPDEYRQKLKEKLVEEVEEFQSESTLEEYIDVLEVLAAIAREKGFTDAEIERVRQKKATERGLFQERIILEEA